MKILEHAKNNIIAGIHNATPEYAEKMIKKGFQLVTIGSDQKFIASGASQTINKLKNIKSKDNKGY